MDLQQYAVLFAIISICATFLVARAYKNTKFNIKHKIALKREDAVIKEMNKKMADEKKLIRKEKDEWILWKKNEVADYEATTFSIFYTNALFLFLLLVCSFILLRSVSPLINYTGSMSVGAGLVFLFSTGGNKQ